MVVLVVVDVVEYVVAIVEVAVVVVVPDMVEVVDYVIIVFEVDDVEVVVVRAIVPPCGVSAPLTVQPAFPSHPIGAPGVGFCLGTQEALKRIWHYRAAADTTTGSSAKQPRESEEMSNTMMTILVGYLDFDSTNIQEVTLLGFAKLLLHDRIVSGRLLPEKLGAFGC